MSTTAIACSCSEMGRATSWLSRAERLHERAARECAERGYLLLPVVEARLKSGDFESTYAAVASPAFQTSLMKSRMISAFFSGVDADPAETKFCMVEKTSMINLPNN